MSQDQESSTSTDVTRTERNRNAHEFKNKYRITSVFGTGSFGVVFKCHRLSDNAVVAAKKLPMRNISTWTTLDGKRVPMEIFALQRLANIEGVAKLLDFYNFGHYYLIVMESGENLTTLRQYLETKKKIDEEEARIYVKQLVSTLDSCHQQGISHQDITTSNILIDANTKKLLLIDFGIAKYDENEISPHDSRTEMFYSPESIQFIRSISEIISVRSIGATLHCMIFGTSPFQSEEKIIKEQQEFHETLTPQCQNFLRVCLNKKDEGKFKLKQLLDHPFISTENKQQL